MKFAINGYILDSEFIYIIGEINPINYSKFNEETKEYENHYEWMFSIKFFNEPNSFKIYNSDFNKLVEFRNQIINFCNQNKPNLPQFNL